MIVVGWISVIPHVLSHSVRYATNKLFINWISNMLDRNMLYLLMNGNCPYIFYTMILDPQVIVKSIIDTDNNFQIEICKHFWINLDCCQGFHCRQCKIQTICNANRMNINLLYGNQAKIFVWQSNSPVSLVFLCTIFALEMLEIVAVLMVCMVTQKRKYQAIEI